MIILKLLPILFFVPLALSGCDKDDDESNTQNNAELIADKNWVLTGHTSKENNDPIEDLYPTYDNCDTDDVYRFSKNGTFEVNEGATKCDPTDAQVYSQGTWSIKQDSLITTETGGIPESAKIEELTNSKLVLSSSESLQSNTYVQVLTFTAK